MSSNLSDNMVEEEKKEIPTPPPKPIHPSGFIPFEKLNDSIRIDDKLKRGTFGRLEKITYFGKDNTNTNTYAMKTILKKTHASMTWFFERLKLAWELITQMSARHMRGQKMPTISTF